MRPILILLLLFSTKTFYSNSLDSLKRQLNSDTSLVQRAITLNDIGVIYGSQAHYDSAIYYITESTKILEELKDSIKLSKRYTNIGSLLIQLQQEKKGLKYLQKARELAFKKNDSALYGAITMNMGVAYYNLHNYDSALMLYETAYEMQLKRKDTLGTAPTIMNIGIIYDIKKDFKKSIEWYSKSLSIIEKFNYDDLPHQKKMLVTTNKESAYINLASSYNQLKNYNQAIVFYKKVIDSNTEFSSLQSKLYAYKGLKSIYKTIGNYKKGLEMMEHYDELKDSLLNESKQKTINEISIKYESEKQEKENNLLKIKNELIHKNNLLKDQKISNNRILLAFTVIIMLLCLVMLFYFISRNKKIKRLNEKLEQQNIEISIAKQKIELKALLNQINPHFIFNTLNSIQQFIVSNDVDSSLDYFNKFSSLIRSSLEHSELKFVTINEEIRAIKNYLALENLRYENKIETVFSTVEIDQFNTEIPPMFIQPLVENSIVHGFNNKKKLKRIRIELKEDAEKIVCIVTDNGIGINSMLNKKSKHKNSGLVITRKRLQSIWNNHEENMKIRIEDLNDMDENQHGTRVTINLPRKI